MKSVVEVRRVLRMLMLSMFLSACRGDPTTMTQLPLNSSDLPSTLVRICQVLIENPSVDTLASRLGKHQQDELNGPGFRTVTSAPPEFEKLLVYFLSSQDQVTLKAQFKPGQGITVGALKDKFGPFRILPQDPGNFRRGQIAFEKVIGSHTCELNLYLEQLKEKVEDTDRVSELSILVWE